MNVKELLAIRREIQLLKDSRGDYVVSTITELEPLLELFQSLLKQAELRGRIDEVRLFRKAMTFEHAAPINYEPKRIAELEAEMEKEG